MRYDAESINRRKENMKITRRIVEIVAIVLIYNIILVAMSSANKANLISVFGYKSYIIRTNSMEPTVKIGDVVIVKKVKEQDIKSGDVITFLQDGEVITHRIIKIDDSEGIARYITKGDNNNVEDTFKVTYDDIVGKHMMTIPYLGKVVQVLDSKIILLVITLIVLIYIFVRIQNKEKIENRREKKRIEESKKRI